MKLKVHLFLNTLNCKGSSRSVGGSISILTAEFVIVSFISFISIRVWLIVWPVYKVIEIISICKWDHFFFLMI